MGCLLAQKNSSEKKRVPRTKRELNRVVVEESILTPYDFIWRQQATDDNPRKWKESHNLLVSLR